MIFKKRSPLAVLGLSIVTLGIYCICWLVLTRREIIAANGDQKSIPSVIYLFVPLIAMVLAVVPLVFVGNQTVEQSHVGVVLIILAIVSVMAWIVLPLWWMYRYCKAVTALTSQYQILHAPSFGALYGLWILIWFFVGIAPLWMMIVQNDLNGLADKVTGPTNPTYPDAAPAA